MNAEIIQIFVKWLRLFRIREVDIFPEMWQEFIDTGVWPIDGQMDVVVEIAPSVEESVEVGSIFGHQQQEASGKREIKFAFFDHLGTAKMLTDNDGQITWPRNG